MIYYIDIDNTICYTKIDNNISDYINSIPDLKRIDHINQLYDQGHTIIYWTARGSRSGQDYSELTIDQLNAWGCKRHEIKFGKPVYDVWVDDKSIEANFFFDKQL